MHESPPLRTDFSTPSRSFRKIFAKRKTFKKHARKPFREKTTTIEFPGNTRQPKNDAIVRFFQPVFGPRRLAIKPTPKPAPFTELMTCLKEQSSLKERLRQSPKHGKASLFGKKNKEGSKGLIISCLQESRHPSMECRLSKISKKTAINDGGAAESVRTPPRPAKLRKWKARG